MVATPSENKSIYILLFQHVSQLPQRSGNKCGNYTTSEQDAVIIRALWCALGLTCFFFFLKRWSLQRRKKKKKKKDVYWKISIDSWNHLQGNFIAVLPYDTINHNNASVFEFTHTQKRGQNDTARRKLYITLINRAGAVTSPSVFAPNDLASYRRRLSTFA